MARNRNAPGWLLELLRRQMPGSVSRNIGAGLGYVDAFNPSQITATTTAAPRALPQPYGQPGYLEGLQPASIYSLRQQGVMPRLRRNPNKLGYIPDYEGVLPISSPLSPAGNRRPQFRRRVFNNPVAETQGTLPPASDAFSRSRPKGYF